MRTYNIFLDDIREPAEVYNYTKNPVYLKKAWKIVRTHQEFVDLLNQMVKDKMTAGSISLDHDLSPEHYNVPFEVFELFTSERLGMEENGYDSVQYLTDHIDKHKWPHPGITVHSMNPVGKRRMEEHLMDWMDKLGGDADEK